MKAAVKEFAPRPVRQETWDGSPSGSATSRLDFADASGEERAGRELLSELDEEHGTGGNRVYYLAVPPTRDRDDRRRRSASAASTGAGRA